MKDYEGKLGPFDFHDIENVGRNFRIQSLHGIYFNTEWHGIWQILDEWIKRRAVHLIKWWYGWLCVNNKALLCECGAAWNTHETRLCLTIWTHDKV